MSKITHTPPIASPDDRLWAALHAWRHEGLHFQRQANVGPYTVDYLCREERIIVELDARPLRAKTTRRAAVARTRVLEKRGYIVLRFWADHVGCDLDSVLRIIATAMDHGDAVLCMDQRQERMAA